MHAKIQHIIISTICLILGCIAVAHAQISFTEVTSIAGIDHHYLGVNEMGAGAAFFDFDNDGDEDLWLSGGLNQDALYENDGTGYFTEIGQQAGLEVTTTMVTTGVITGDLDNDGFTDVLLITHRGAPNFILKNNGDKTFSLQNLSGLERDDAYSLAAAMADINQDGLLDIYAGHYIQKDRLEYHSENQDSIIGFDHECYANKLYINQGNFTFAEASAEWQARDEGCALATAFTDYDGDFDADLMIANDFGEWVLPNALLENRQNSFSDVSASSGMDVGIYGMGIAIGDYDNDLDLDYYITNLGKNVLLNNKGNGTFSDATQIAGIEDEVVSEGLLATGWGTALVDFDNDADLDLYVVNGYVPAADFIDNAEANPNRCYENDGEGGFQRVLSQTPVESTRRGRGLAYADIDNDGDIDFLVGNVNKHATSDTIQKVQLFRNDTPNDFNWLKIKLEGVQNNRDGIGSQVRIKAGGRWYLQEANGGYGTHASQHSKVLHFGLGQAQVIDSMIVYWPGGIEQIATGFQVNQTLSIQEGQLITRTSSDYPDNLTITAFPNPFVKTVTIQYHLPKTMTVGVRIMDAMGRQIFQRSPKNMPSGKHQLEWEASQSGIYLIQLRLNNHILFKTLFSN